MTIVFCSNQKEFDDWLKLHPATPSAAPLFSLAGTRLLDRFVIDNIVYAGTWFLNPKRDEIIRILKSRMPVSLGKEISIEGSHAIALAPEPEWNGFEPVISYNKHASFNAGPFPASPLFPFNPPEPNYVSTERIKRDGLIREIEHICRRVSMENLEQILKVAQAIRSLHIQEEPKESPAPFSKEMHEAYLKAMQGVDFSHFTWDISADSSLNRSSAFREALNLGGGDRPPGSPGVLKQNS